MALRCRWSLEVIHLGCPLLEVVRVRTSDGCDCRTTVRPTGSVIGLPFKACRMLLVQSGAGRSPCPKAITLALEKIARENSAPRRGGGYR